MNRLCLDTSAYVHFRRGDSKVVELIDAATWIGVPAVTIGELLVGFAGGDRHMQNERALDTFLANACVEVLAVDVSVARLYAEILAALRKAGTPVPTNDLWIAATAALHGATVLTFNRHFAQIQRVGSIVLTSS